MEKYREHIRDNRRKGLKMMIEERGISKQHARSKAIQYPGYLIRYTLGGFVITFHLLIFIASMPRLLWHHYYAFGWIFEMILPILISYALQSLFAKLSSRLIDNRDQASSEVGNNAQSQPVQNTPANQSQWKEKLKNNLKNILQYFILVASKTFFPDISNEKQQLSSLDLRLFYRYSIFDLSFDSGTRTAYHLHQSH